MVTKLVVQPGQTLVAHGGLRGGQFKLLVDGGTTAAGGGVLEVQAAVTNMDLVTFYGAAVAGATGASGIIQSAGVLTNLGTINVSSGGAPQNYQASGATLSIDGVLANAGTLFDGTNGFGAALIAIAQGGTLANTATLDISAGANSTNPTYIGHGGTITDAGILTNSGELVIASAIGTTTVLGDAGLVRVTGVLDNTGTLQLTAGYNEATIPNPDACAKLIDTGYGYINNSGTIIVKAGYFFSHPAYGATVSIGGSMTNFGSMLFYGGASTTPSFSPGGDLIVTGELSNQGQLFVGAHGGQGNMSVSGRLYNAGTIGAYGGSTDGQNSYHPGSTIDIAGTFDNTGLVTLMAGHPPVAQYTAGEGAVLLDRGSIVNLGTITIAGPSAPGATVSTASLTIATRGTLSNQGSIGGTGTLVNDGTLQLAVSTPVTVATIVNNGTIVSFGEGGITSGITSSQGQSGVIDLSQFPTTLDGPVAANQTVIFGGLYTDLTLGHALSFAGTLEGLAPGNAIDLAGLTATTAQLSGTLLAVGLADGMTLDLALAAPLPTGDFFNLTADGTGGTRLTLYAPGSETHTVFDTTAGVHLPP